VTAVATRSRYEFLATQGGVLWRPRPRHAGHPGGRVRGADHPLRGEWDLIVIGPRFAAALAAKDLGDGGAVTHDRDLVVRAAEPLLRRLVPEG
jgi:hypothetical protein